MASGRSRPIVRQHKMNESDCCLMSAAIQKRNISAIRRAFELWAGAGCFL